MAKNQLDYDGIAATYDRRFKVRPEHDQTLAPVRQLAANIAARRILEVGCGTAHWLAGLGAPGRLLVGLDYSTGMLARAQERNATAHLVRARAGALPFARQSFDLIYCINAIHHFGDQQAFVNQAFHALRPGGALAIIGMDPHSQPNDWYVYDFFPGTRQVDLDRFPSWGQILTWLVSAGFERVDWQPVLDIHDPKTGKAVLADPFLVKSATSQLALLSDEEYAAGLREIESAIAQARAAGRTITFQTDIRLAMISARRSAGAAPN